MLRLLSSIFGRPSSAAPPLSDPGPSDFRLLGSRRASEGLKLVGTSHYQGEIARVVGRPKRGGHEAKFRAILQHEPDNPHDPNAIRVAYQGRTLGYVPANSTAAFHRAMASASVSGLRGNVTVAVLGGDTHSQYRNFGLSLVCDFPIRLKT